MAIPSNPPILLGHSPGTDAACCPNTEDPDAVAWGSSPNTQAKCVDGTNTTGYHWVRQRSAGAEQMSHASRVVHTLSITLVYSPLTLAALYGIKGRVCLECDENLDIAV